MKTFLAPTYCLHLPDECEWGEDEIRLYGNFLFIFPVLRIGLIIARSSSDGAIPVPSKGCLHSISCSALLLGETELSFSPGIK
jgi:hypothetical protein